jgi:DNA-binding transcriptional LysR family regulator
MHTQLRDVEYFAAIAEHGQVQRAAAALGLSQPALSKSLRRLELSMKAKLLVRTPKGVELTSVGSALLAQVRKLRLSLDDVTREIADLSQGRSGYLRIGTAPGFAIHLVPAACDALLREAPRVRLRITVSSQNTTLSGLRNGELDLAVITIQPPQNEDHVTEYLYDEEFIVFAAANHRLAKHRHLTVADLAQERWALSATHGRSEQLLSEAIGNAGLSPPSIAVETTFLPLRYQLVAGSDLLSFGSRRVVQYAAKQFRLTELPVKELTYTRRIGVAYRMKAYLSPAARRLIEILKTTAKEITQEKQKH